MKKVFIESPCFGFGPISTSISLAKQIQKNYDVEFITYGEAKEFLEKNLNNHIISIDTRYEKNFDKLLNYINKKDIIVVNTNVELSVYLLKKGYKVLTVDTLYWMWNNVPKIYTQNPYFIAQTYYGQNITKLPLKIECRPIINYDIWKPESVLKNANVLISFGGMAEPGEHTFILKYAHFIIRHIISCFHNINIDTFYVVGGLFSKQDKNKYNKKVKIIDSLEAGKYKKLVNKCSYIFLSPGLTSLYEMMYAQRKFCLLPGLSVSQVYQVNHFKEKFNFPFCIVWKDSSSLIKKFDKLPELEALTCFESYMNSLKESDINFEKVISEYIKSVNHSQYYWINNKEIKRIYNKRDFTEIAVHMLKQMEGKDSSE